MINRIKVNRMERLVMLVLSFSLVLALIFAAAPQSASAATCKFKHKVVAGETLIIIANLYQTDWREIAEANELKEPYAVVVGDVLCIPSGTSPGADPDTSEDTGKPSLEAVPAFKHVLVIVKNIAKNKVYNVRLGDGPAGKETSNFIMIGRLKTNDGGNFEGYFQLPAELQLVSKLQVCLKDPFTDETACQGYENLVAHHMQALYSCAKPGR